MRRRPEHPKAPTLHMVEVSLLWAQQDASKEHSVYSTHGIFGAWEFTYPFTLVST